VFRYDLVLTNCDCEAMGLDKRPDSADCRFLPTTQRRRGALRTFSMSAGNSNSSYTFLAIAEVRNASVQQFEYRPNLHVLQNDTHVEAELGISLVAVVFTGRPTPSLRCVRTK
jgi:hypothetical protein